MSKKIVIIGLGITGLACARHLKRLNRPFSVIDTREAPPQLAEFKQAFPEVPLSLGRLDVPMLHEADVIVISPGLDPADALIAAQAARGANIIGDIELFAQSVKAPVIAITGTNAKSTVTTLVGLMMKEAGYHTGVGGNLGLPALDLLAQTPAPDVYVLELSSFQLDVTYSLKPKVATILNVTPDHLDRYTTYEAYQASKQRVYLGAEQAVCFLEDKLTHAKQIPALYFTTKTPATSQFWLLTKAGETYLAFGEKVLMPVSELPVLGKHYQINALASLAIGHAFGLAMEPMLKVLKTFQGLPHRCEFVREYHGVRWVNDSKGTNVGATQAAVVGVGSAIQGKLILIAGGVGKGADFTTLGPVLSQYARHVVLIGEAANELAAVLKSAVPYTFAASMQEAVNQASAAAESGDCVLLSPACASFDMFQNYEHRGKVFSEMVARL